MGDRHMITSNFDPMQVKPFFIDFFRTTDLTESMGRVFALLQETRLVCQTALWDCFDDAISLLSSLLHTKHVKNSYPHDAVEHNTNQVLFLRMASK